MAEAGGEGRAFDRGPPVRVPAEALGLRCEHEIAFRRPPPVERLDAQAVPREVQPARPADAMGWRPPGERSMMARRRCPRRGWSTRRNRRRPRDSTSAAMPRAILLSSSASRRPRGSQAPAGPHTLLRSLAPQGPQAKCPQNLRGKTAFRTLPELYNPCSPLTTQGRHGWEAPPVLCDGARPRRRPRPATHPGRARERYRFGKSCLRDGRRKSGTGRPRTAPAIVIRRSRPPLSGRAPRDREARETRGETAGR